MAIQPHYLHRIERFISSLVSTSDLSDYRGSSPFYRGLHPLDLQDNAASALYWWPITMRVNFISRNPAIVADRRGLLSQPVDNYGIQMLALHEKPRLMPSRTSYDFIQRRGKITKRYHVISACNRHCPKTPAANASWLVKGEGSRW